MAKIAWTPLVLLVAVPVAADELDAQEALVERIQEIELRAEQLRRSVGDTEAQHCERVVREARLALGEDPHVSASLLALVSRQCPEAAGDASLLLDTARIEAAVGTTNRALQHFAAASRIAREAHVLAPAVEGYVALAERVGHGRELPPVERYIELVGRKNRLDRVGYETIYRLGRTLARRHDQRALAILSQIPNNEPAGRRALYVRGVVHLEAGDVDTARTLFLEAAELPAAAGMSPDETVRDARVSELAWLAVGRLAFEGEDAATGFYAYQQVLVHSPAFDTAFLELGWLAMETGEEAVAMLAFEPLIRLDPRGEVGRRAGLLKGYVLLEQKEYDQARRHYQAVAARYARTLDAFEREVARIEDLADLVHDCDVRDNALTNLVLAPMMNRQEIERARRLNRRLEVLAAQSEAAAQQLRAVEDLLTGRRRPNPLRALARARETAVELLQEANALAARIERTSRRERWRADAQPAAGEPGCCEEPHARLRTLRAALESLVLSLEKREQQTRAGLESLRRGLHETHTRDRQRYETLVPKVHERQRKLAARAIAVTRKQLLHTAMEGDAGVLESIWRFKEDHRNLIKSLEIERKTRIRQLEQRLYDALMELYAAE